MQNCYFLSAEATSKGPGTQKDKGVLDKPSRIRQYPLKDIHFFDDLLAV